MLDFETVPCVLRPSTAVMRVLAYGRSENATLPVQYNLSYLSNQQLRSVSWITYEDVFINAVLVWSVRRAVETLPQKGLIATEGVILRMTPADM